MPREMSSAEVASFMVHGTRPAKVATTMSAGQPHVMLRWVVDFTQPKFREAVAVDQIG